MKLTRTFELPAAAGPAGRGALQALLLWLSVAYATHVVRVFAGPTIDDAAITYAYADNLAHGRGLRLTPGEAPTEGFSNFLEVLLLAPFARFTDLDRPAKLINVGVVAALLFLLTRFVAARLNGLLCLLAALPILIVFSWPGFSYWISAGLEGGLLTALQIGSLLTLAASRQAAPGSDAARHADVGLGLTAGLLAWCRPEGAIYGAIAVGARWLMGPGARRPTLLAGGLVLALVVVRWLVFRDFVPNTYWAKINDEIASDGGSGYLYNFFSQRAWYFGCALPLLAPWAPRLGPVALAAFGQLGFAFVFAWYSGGDWMKEFRFLQPVMGPLITLHGLGILAVCERPGDSIERRLGTVFAFVSPLLLWTAIGPGWAETARKVTAARDVDMRKLAFVGTRYRDLGERMHLGRPLVMADVDAGGTSYRSGLDVIDLGGLGDRVLGRAAARDSGRVVDYLFGERRPETIHVHGPWQNLIPFDQLASFKRLYRALDTASLNALSVGPLTGVRADLVDPPARPVERRFAQLMGARMLGFSAVPVAHEMVLFVHARSEGALPTLSWKGPDGALHKVAFNAGLGLNDWPAGTPLVGMARVPATGLPLVLQGVAAAPGDTSEVRLTQWPTGVNDAATVEGLGRLALVRLAGAPWEPCDPRRLLDDDAPAVARARGAALAARLCGPPPVALRAGLAAEARRASAEAKDPDDAYEAAVAARLLAPPGGVSERVRIEEARGAHQPWDEILHGFAARELGGKVPTAVEIERGLGLLYVARAYDDLLLAALAFGHLDEPRARPVLCATAAQLGLRAGGVAAPFDCTGVAKLAPPRVLRQGFEDARDPRVAYQGVASRWRARAARNGQRRLLGTQGGWFINTYLGPGEPDPGSAPAAHEAGEITWGPFPLPGRHFGVLVAGGGAQQSHVRVEEQRGAAWAEVWRSHGGPSANVLSPQLADLPSAPGTVVRVRVIEDPAATIPLVADAPTFVDF